MRNRIQKLGFKYTSFQAYYDPQTIYPFTPKGSNKRKYLNDDQNCPCDAFVQSQPSSLTNFQQSNRSKCKICQQCLTCTYTAEITTDELIDSLDLILKKRFAQQSMQYPVTIQKQTANNATQKQKVVIYSFVYNNGLKISVQVNLAKGDVTIDQRALISQQNSTSNTSLIAVLSSNALKSEFFAALTKIALPTTRQQLIDSFIFRNFFSKIPFVQAQHIKLIYLRNYSAKYFRLIYVLWNGVSQFGVFQFVVNDGDLGMSLLKNVELTQDVQMTRKSNEMFGALYYRSEQIVASDNIATVLIKQQTPVTINLPSNAAGSNTTTKNSTVNTNTTNVSSPQTEQYKQISIKSPQSLMIENFLSNYFYRTYNRLTLIKVQREAVIQLQQEEVVSYRLTYRVKKNSMVDEPLHYEIIVTKYIKRQPVAAVTVSPQVTFQIVGSTYLNLLHLSDIKPSLQKNTLNQSQVSTDTYLPYIDTIILKQFSAQIGKQPFISRIKRHEPYYELTYLDLQQKEIKFTVLYEVVMNMIEFYVEGKNKDGTAFNTSSQNQGVVKNNGSSSGGVSTPPVINTTVNPINNNSNSNKTDSKTNGTTTTQPKTGNNSVSSNSSVVNNNNQTSNNKTVSNNTTSATATTPLNNSNSNVNLPTQNTNQSVANKPVQSQQSSLSSTSTSTNSSSSLRLSLLPPTPQKIPSLNYSLFSKMQNYQVDSKVSQIVRYLLQVHGQRISYFMKLRQAYAYQKGLLNQPIEYYRLIFQIRRFQNHPNPITLYYEIIASITWNSSAIQILIEQYASEYAQSIPETVDIHSILSFDTANLLEDQYFSTINQKLLSTEIREVNSGTRTYFNSLIKGSYVKRVGRYLPYYWVQYMNGVEALVWYEVLLGKVLVLSMRGPGGNVFTMNGEKIQPLNANTNNTNLNNNNSASNSSNSNNTISITPSPQNNNTNPTNNSSQNKTAIDTNTPPSPTPQQVNNQNTSKATENKNTTIIVSNNTSTKNQTNTAVTPIKQITEIKQESDIREPVLIKEDTTVDYGIREPIQIKQEIIREPVKIQEITDGDLFTGNNRVNNLNNLNSTVIRQPVQIKEIRDQLESIRQPREILQQDIQASNVNKTVINRDKSISSSTPSPSNAQSDTKISLEQEDTRFSPITIHDQTQGLIEIQQSTAASISSRQSDNIMIINRNDVINHINDQFPQQLRQTDIQGTTTTNNNDNADNVIQKPANLIILNRTNPNQNLMPNTPKNQSNTLQVSQSFQNQFKFSLSGSSSSTYTNLINQWIIDNYWSQVKKFYKSQRAISVDFSLSQELMSDNSNSFIIGSETQHWRYNSRIDLIKNRQSQNNLNHKSEETLNWNKIFEMMVYELDLKKSLMQKMSFKLILQNVFRTSFSSEQGYQLLISCPGTQKAFELILLSFKDLKSYVMLEFRQIYSIKELSNDPFGQANKYTISGGNPMLLGDQLAQFQLTQAYSSILDILPLKYAKSTFKFRQVRVSFMPSGMIHELNYEITQNLQQQKKQTMSFPTLYSTMLSIGSVVGINIISHIEQGIAGQPPKAIISQNLEWTSLSAASSKNSKYTETFIQSLQLKIRVFIKTALSLNADINVNVIELSQMQIYSSEGKLYVKVIINYSQHSVFLKKSLIATFQVTLRESSVQYVKLLQFQMPNGLYSIIVPFYPNQLSKNSPQIQKIVNQATIYSAQILKSITTEILPEMIMALRLSNNVMVYRVFYNNPFVHEVVFTQTQLNNDNRLKSVYSIQTMRRINSLQTSQYYDQTKFQLFGLKVSTPKLKEDLVYQSLYSIASKNYASINNSNIITVFKSQSFNTVNYYVILQQRTMTARLSHSEQMFLLEMRLNKYDKSKYFLNISPLIGFPITGFYSRGCQSLAPNGGMCQMCLNSNTQMTSDRPEQRNMLADGRCFKKIDFCLNQLAYKCMVCEQGYYLNQNSKCILNRLRQSQSLTQSKPTITNSVAKQQVLLNRICKTFDVQGRCVECPTTENHILFQNQCYLRSEVNKFSQKLIALIKKDTSCNRWASNICLSCIEGTSFGSTRACKISLQNCLSFDNTTQKCAVCSKFYIIKDGRCLKQ